MAKLILSAKAEVEAVVSRFNEGLLALKDVGVTKLEAVMASLVSEAQKGLLSLLADEAQGKVVMGHAQHHNVARATRSQEGLALLASRVSGNRKVMEVLRDLPVRLEKAGLLAKTLSEGGASARALRRSLAATEAAKAASAARVRQAERLAAAEERRSLVSSKGLAEAVFVRGEANVGLLSEERLAIIGQEVTLAVASAPRKGAEIRTFKLAFGDIFSPWAIGFLGTGIVPVSDRPWEEGLVVTDENLWDWVAKVLLANSNGMELLNRVARGEIYLAVDGTGKVADHSLVKAHQDGIGYILGLAAHPEVDDALAQELVAKLAPLPNLLPTGITVAEGIWHREAPVGTWFKKTAEGKWISHMDPKKLGTRIEKLFLNTSAPAIGVQDFFILTGGLEIEKSKVLNDMFSTGASYPATEQFRKTGSARFTSPAILLKTVSGLRPSCFDVPKLKDRWIAAFSSVKAGGGAILSSLLGHDWFDTMTQEEAEAAFKAKIKKVTIPCPEGSGKRLAVEGVFVDLVPVRATSMYAAYKLKPTELANERYEDLKEEWADMEDEDKSSSAHSVAEMILRDRPDGNPIAKILGMMKAGLIAPSVRNSKWNHQDFHLLARSFGLETALQFLENEFKDRANGKSIEAFHCLKEAQVVGQPDFVGQDPMEDGEGIVEYSETMLSTAAKVWFSAGDVSATSLSLAQANALFGGFDYVDADGQTRRFAGFLNHTNGFVVRCGGFPFYFPSAGLMGGQYRPGSYDGEGTVIVGSIAKCFNLLLVAAKNAGVNWERAYYSHHAALSEAIMDKKVGTVNIPGLSLTLLPAWWATAPHAVYWSDLENYAPAKADGGPVDAIYTKQPALFNNAVCKVRVYGKDEFPEGIRQLLNEEDIAFGSRNILYVSPELLLSQHNDCDGDAARLSFPSEKSLGLLTYWKGQDALFRRWEDKYVHGEQDMDWSIKHVSEFSDGLMTEGGISEIAKAHEAHGDQPGWTLDAFGLREYHCAACAIADGIGEGIELNLLQPGSYGLPGAAKTFRNVRNVAHALVHGDNKYAKKAGDLLIGLDQKGLPVSPVLSAAKEAADCQALVGIESNVLYRVSMACEYIESRMKAKGTPLTHEQKHFLYVLQEVVAMVLQDEAMSGAKHSLTGEGFAEVFSMGGLTTQIAQGGQHYELYIEKAIRSFEVYVDMDDARDFFGQHVRLFEKVCQVIDHAGRNTRTRRVEGKGIQSRPLIMPTWNFGYNGGADIFMPSVVKGIIKRLDFAKAFGDHTKGGGYCYNGNGQACFTATRYNEEGERHVVLVPHTSAGTYEYLEYKWNDQIHAEEFYELASRGLALLPGSKLGKAVLDSKPEFVNAAIASHIAAGRRRVDILVEDIQKQEFIVEELKSKALKLKLELNLLPAAGNDDDSVNALVKKIKKAAGRINGLKKLNGEAQAKLDAGIVNLKLAQKWVDQNDAQINALQAMKEDFRLQIKAAYIGRHLARMEASLAKAEARLVFLQEQDPFIKDDLGHALAAGEATRVDLCQDELVREELTRIAVEESEFAMAAAEAGSMVPDFPSEEDLPEYSDEYDQMELVEDSIGDVDYHQWDSADVAEDDGAFFALAAQQRLDLQ